MTTPTDDAIRQALEWVHFFANVQNTVEVDARATEALNTINAVLQSFKAAPEQTDIADLVREFAERNDNDNYPFKGEEYDVELVTFAFKWLASTGKLPGVKS